MSSNNIKLMDKASTHSDDHPTAGESVELNVE